MKYIIPPDVFKILQRLNTFQIDNLSIYLFAKLHYIYSQSFHEIRFTKTVLMTWNIIKQQQVLKQSNLILRLFFRILGAIIFLSYNL